MPSFLHRQLRLTFVLGLLIAIGVGCSRGKSSQTLPTSGSQRSGPSTVRPAVPVASSTSIEGRWQRISWEINGESLPEFKFPIYLEIAGNRATFTLGTRVFADGTIKFDANQSPKTIDLVVTSRMGSSNGRTESSFGIYEISGDTLTTCSSGDSPASRPKNFSFPKGMETVIMKFRRLP
jgi:uncharacterized protein (TIGR03067 family)